MNWNEQNVTKGRSIPSSPDSRPTDCKSSEVLDLPSTPSGKPSRLRISEDALSAESNKWVLPDTPPDIDIRLDLDITQTARVSVIRTRQVLDIQRQGVVRVRINWLLWVVSCELCVSEETTKSEWIVVVAPFYYIQWQIFLAMITTPWALTKGQPLFCFLFFLFHHPSLFCSRNTQTLFAIISVFFCWRLSCTWHSSNDDISVFVDDRFVAVKQASWLPFIASNL